MTGWGRGLDARHQGGAAVEQGFEASGPFIRLGPQAAQFIQIVARAKGFARARQDNDTGLPVFGQGVEFAVQDGQHFV